MPAPETSYAPAVSGAGPPFRATQVQTLVNGVPTLVDMEIIGLADAEGRILGSDALMRLLDPGTMWLNDVYTLLLQLTSSAQIRGQVNADLALTVDARRGKLLLPAAIDTAASGDTTIVRGVPGQKIKVVNYTLVAAAAVTARWLSGKATGQGQQTNLSGAMAFAANGGAAPTSQPAAHLFETAQGQDLVLNLGGAVQVSGHLMYFLEP